MAVQTFTNLLNLLIILHFVYQEQSANLASVRCDLGCKVWGEL